MELAWRLSAGAPAQRLAPLRSCRRMLLGIPVLWPRQVPAHHVAFDLAAAGLHSLRLERADLVQRALLQLIEEALCDLFRRFQVDLLTP